MKCHRSFTVGVHFPYPPKHYIQTYVDISCTLCMRPTHSTSAHISFFYALLNDDWNEACFRYYALQNVSDEPCLKEINADANDGFFWKKVYLTTRCVWFCRHSCLQLQTVLESSSGYYWCQHFRVQFTIENCSFYGVITHGTNYMRDIKTSIL